jgi:hypothetical protein
MNQSQAISCHHNCETVFHLWSIRSAYDPDADGENNGLHTGARLIELICELASDQMERKFGS